MIKYYLISWSIGIINLIVTLYLHYKTKEKMKTENQPTRQQSQDLILLVHWLGSNLVLPSVDVQELLLALNDANLTLVSVPQEDATALFALQLLNNPQLQNYDSSIEVLV